MQNASFPDIVYGLPARTEGRRADRNVFFYSVSWPGPVSQTVDS